ncbi:hypothetical protein CHCC14814_2342 [Bacillus paralicheniformis]|nr:hypothetical protein CHCC14814_2342 [Bacillus paralicheniformis]
MLKNFFFEAKHQTPVEKGGRKISVSNLNQIKTAHAALVWQSQ